MGWLARILFAVQAGVGGILLAREGMREMQEANRRTPAEQEERARAGWL